VRVGNAGGAEDLSQLIRADVSIRLNTSIIQSRCPLPGHRRALQQAIHLYNLCAMFILQYAAVTTKVSDLGQV
jgi:hypothetical protein